MSVRRIVCPECRYELLYAMLGAKGSYKTGTDFAATCARRAEVDARNAMTCPVLRAVVETELRAQFPGREVSR